MNILASWKWLNELIDLKGLTPEMVAARVSLSGPGIEKIIPQGKDFDKIVVGKITSIEPHPSADRLRVALVDIGASSVRIVCGGSNIEVGQFVPVALIGARVRWHGEGDLIELQPIEIRGVASEGMICAANEIGLGDAFLHGEKEILDLGTVITSPPKWLQPGQPLADALAIADEYILDTEVTTNRPDAMGMEGFACEVATILGRSWSPVNVAAIEYGIEELPVFTQGERDGKPLCPRFMAVKIDGVKVGPSPWWMKHRLIMNGIKPINTIVDITNYVMLEMGQPLHAYDAAKVDGAFVVAPVQKGSFEALNKKTYELQPGMLGIHDDKGLIGLAGVMGGMRTAVQDETTSVIFEAANFDEVSIRRTSRALDLMTDASKLFEKGLSVRGPERALSRAVEVCLAMAGGKVVSKIADTLKEPYKPSVYSVKEEEVCRLIGVEIPGEQMQIILERLGFDVVRKNGLLTATTPWWRDHDIEDGRDLVEEIARIYGYANMPPVFPAGMTPVASDPSFAFEQHLRSLNKAFGFTELMSYSFLSREQLERTQMSPDSCLRLQNPLSQDAEFMRPSLLPSMLQAVVDNQERASELRLFELSRVYRAQVDKPVLPEETDEFIAAILLKDVAWSEAKGLAEALLQDLGITEGKWARFVDGPVWHPGRSLRYVLNGNPLVTVGELHPQLAEAWKIERRLGLVQASLADLQKVAAKSKSYKALPAFPDVERDLAIDVAEKIEIAQVAEVMITSNQALLESVTWFETYRGQGLDEGQKSLAFHLKFRAVDRTLASEEVDAVMKGIREQLTKEVGATFRG